MECDIDRFLDFSLERESVYVILDISKAELIYILDSIHGNIFWRS